METDLKKTFWTEAAKAGLVLGLIMVLYSLLSWILHLEIKAKGVDSFVNFIVMAVCIYVYGRKRAAQYSSQGFSYSQSMSYILAIMLFSGFITGVGTYIMQNHIAHDYYKEMLDTAIMNSGMDIDNAQVEQAMGMAQKLMKSAVFMIFAGLFNMLIYGCFIGLIASIFIKKSPNPFNNQQNAE